MQGQARAKYPDSLDSVWQPTPVDRDIQLDDLGREVLVCPGDSAVLTVELAAKPKQGPVQQQQQKHWLLQAPVVGVLARRVASVRMRGEVRDELPLLGVMLMPCIAQRFYTASLVPLDISSGNLERWFLEAVQTLTMYVMASAALWFFSALLAATRFRGPRRVLGVSWALGTMLWELYLAGVNNQPYSHGQFNLTGFILGIIIFASVSAVVGTVLWAFRSFRPASILVFVTCALVALAVPAVASGRGWENGVAGGRILGVVPGCRVVKPVVEWEQFLLDPVRSVIYTWWALRPCETPPSIAHLDAATGALVLDCPQGGAVYSLLPHTNEAFEDMYVWTEARKRERAYEGPVPRSEWAPWASTAVAECGGRKQVLTLPVVANATLAAQRTAQRRGPPLDVVVVFIDAVSRANAFRQLPRTVRFFDALARDEASPSTVNQFFRYHGVAPDTPRNTRAMFSGNETPSDAEIIWQLYARSGFVTAVVDNTCREWAMHFMRRPAPPDVSPNAVWCMHEYTGYQQDLFDLMRGGSSIRRRCIAGRQADEIAFSHGRAFLDGYDASKFILVKLSEGHELTNKVVSTTDGNVEAFVRSLDLNRTALFFLSDHGLHMGVGWTLHFYSSRLENKLPTLFTALPKWLLAARPGATEVLKSNEQALVSPYDIHATLADLAVGWPWSGAKPNERSLLSVKVPYAHGCKEAGIEDEWCGCSK